MEPYHPRQQQQQQQVAGEVGWIVVEPRQDAAVPGLPEAAADGPSSRPAGVDSPGAAATAEYRPVPVVTLIDGDHVEPYPDNYIVANQPSYLPASGRCWFRTEI